MYGLKYNSDGLVPVITVDAVTNEVLMQAYMNEQAFLLTLETGNAYYYSRSRKKLWLKGEESGNFQRVTEILADCDKDCLLLKVVQKGVACHTGERSCFFNEVRSFDRLPCLTVISALDRTIKSRAANPSSNSYTNYLLDKGVEKICKKVGEETTETVIAAMKDDNKELAEECADLLYHLFVLLQSKGVDYTEVLTVLQNRHVAGSDNPLKESKFKKNAEREEN